METAFVVFLLPPYFENFSKHILKTPKLYFYDTSLVCHLLNIKKKDDLPLHPAKGAIFENMVIANLMKQNLHQHKNLEFFFWRDSNGHEIDLLVPKGDDLHIAAIKASSTVLPSLANNLLKFEALASNRVKSKTLIYRGNDTQNRADFQLKSRKNSLFA